MTNYKIYYVEEDEVSEDLEHTVVVAATPNEAALLFKREHPSGFIEQIQKIER